MLGEMAKWIKSNLPSVPKLISYQDEAVHTGTIYKAAGWTPEYRAKARVRDRSKPRAGTNGRMYRTNSNGIQVDSSPKTRWALVLSS